VILSDGEIQEAISQGLIIISPPPTPEQYTTSALDLIFGDELVELVPPSEFSRDEVPGVERPFVIHLADIDIRAFQARYTRPIPKHPDGSFRLPPNKFVLGITREHVTLPHSSKIAARVEGRSTLARLGLVVHLTAPTIHCGFDGIIVLEICNFGPYELSLMPGKLAICQLIFERLGQEPRGSVSTPFQEQTGIRAR